MTTFATADLCNIMLRDSAHIQEFEAEWRNRKGRRAGVPEFEPLYVMADAERQPSVFWSHVRMENGFIFVMVWKSDLQM